MNKELELEIRQGYSEIYPQLEALALWINNTLSELKLHDEFIYNYKVRIKDIESIIGKVNKHLNNGENFNNFSEVLDRLNDLVACRVILYYSSPMEVVNTFLLNFSRAKAVQSTVHYQEDTEPAVLRKIISEIESDSDIELRIEKNKTGYTGVHYIFHPQPYDSIYHKKRRLHILQI